MLKNTSNSATKTHQSPSKKFSSPQRQMAPQTAPEPIIRKFLNAQYPGKPNIDRWHILTTVPAGYEQQCNMLRALIASYFTGIKGVNDQAIKTYMESPAKIKDILVGDSGYYYTMTARGDIDHLKFHSKHIVHALLHEIMYNVKIRDKSHRQKAEAMHSRTVRLTTLLQSIDKTIARTKQHVANDSAADQLSAMIRNFQEYFSLHAYLLKNALSFVPDVDCAIERIDLAQDLTPFISTLHPHPLKDSSPLKSSPNSRRFHDVHNQVEPSNVTEEDGVLTAETHLSPVRLSPLRYYALEQGIKAAAQAFGPPLVFSDDKRSPQKKRISATQTIPENGSPQKKPNISSPQKNRHSSTTTSLEHRPLQKVDTTPTGLTGPLTGMNISEPTNTRQSPPAQSAKRQLMFNS